MRTPTSATDDDGADARRVADDRPAPGGARACLPPVRAVLRELGRVLVPEQCPGCGAWDVALCRGCRAGLDGPVRRVEQGAPRLDDARHGPLPAWGVAVYAGPVRAAVVAWKDRGRADLGPLLGRVVERAAGEVAATLHEVSGGAEVLVVPVPSAPVARRRRGEDLVAGLAAAAARGLRDAGQDARPSGALVHRGRRVRDQVGLGARARGRNTAGSFALRPGTPVAQGRWCLLVDDVLTTGSTLAACAQVLSRSGALVTGALVLAATPTPGRSGKDLILRSGAPLPPAAGED